ncbi:LOW QUALITY PROTEIN: NARP1 domain-containing protein, partial [Cephalotus follicularis]
VIQAEDPLAEATKYLKLLQRNSPDSLEMLSFEVNMRKHKILLPFQQSLRLDAENPDSHHCLIRFFHKVGSLPEPLADAEKLIWSVPVCNSFGIQFQEKSLIDANKVFLGKHEGYSLMHSSSAAEILHHLEPNKESEAIKVIEDSTQCYAAYCVALGPVGKWKLKDCIAVHKLIKTVLVDHDAALSLSDENQQHFDIYLVETNMGHTYFEGNHSSAMPNSSYKQPCKNPENGGS